MPSSSNTTSNAHPSAAPLSSAGGGGAAFLIRTIDTLRARASDPHHYSLSKLRRHPSVAGLLAAAEEAFVAAASSQHSTADSSQGASGGVSGDLLSSVSASSSQEVAAGDLPRPLIYFFVGDDLCDSEEDGAAAKAAQSGGGSAAAAVRWSLRQVGSLRVSDRLNGRDVTIRRHEYCATAGGPSRDDADDAAALHDGDNNNNSITKINNNEGSASSSAAVAVVETFEESGFLPLCRLFVERRAAAVAQQSCPIFRLLRGGSGSGSDDAIGLTSPPLSPPPEDGEGLFSCKTNDSSSTASTAMFAFPSERPLLASAIAMHCTAAGAGTLASAFAYQQHSSRCGAIASSSNSSSCIATTGGGVGGAALDVSSSYAGISSHGGAATDTANTSSALHDISGASLQLQQTPPTGATTDVSIVLVMNATTNADGEGSSGSSGGDSGRERGNRERGGGVDDLSTVAAESGGDFASASAAYTTTVPPCALSAEAAGRLADGLAAALLTSRTAMIPRDASSHNAYPPTAAVAAAAEQGGAQQSGISSHTASQQQLSQQTQQSQQSQSQQLTLQQQQQEMMKNELLRMGGHQHSGPMPQHGSTAVSSLDVSAVGPSHHQHNNANTLSSSSVRGAVAVGGASAKGGRAEEDEENDRAFSAPQRPAATAGGQQQQQQQQAAVAEEQTHHDQQQQSLLDPFLVSSLAPRTNASSLSAAHWQAAGDGRCEAVWSQRTADKQQQQQQKQFPQKSSRHLAPSVAGLTFSSSNPPSADRGPDPSRFFLGQPSAKALAASKHIVTYFHPQDEGRAAAAAQLNGAAEYAYAIADPSARAAATAAAAERARRRAKGDEDPFNYQQQLAPNQIAYSYDGTSPFWTQKPFWFQTVMADHVQRTVDYGRGAAAAGWKRWRVGPLQSVERSVIVNSVDEVCSFLRVSRAGFFASVALLDTFLNVCEAPAHRRFDAARFRHNLVASGGSSSAAAAVAEIDPLAVDDSDDSVSFTADFSHPNADLLDANNFRCLIIAAVYVAAKLHDVQPPHVRRVIEALGVPVTTDALCQTELRLISTLHFCTHPLTLPDVTAYFAHFPLRPTMDYCRLRWRDVGAKKAAALRNSSTSGLMGSTSVSAAVADMQHQQGASTSASMMGHPPTSVSSISGSTSAAAPPPPSPPAFVPDYTAPLPLPIIDSLRFNIRNIVALVSDIFIRQPAAIAYPSLVAGAAVFKVAVDMSDCAAIVNYEEDDDGYDILEGCGAATVPIEDIKAAAAAAAEARAHPSASAASADASAALASPLLDPSLIVARIEQLHDLLQHYKPRSLGGGGYVGFMVRALRGLLGSAALPMPPQERLGQYYTMRCGMRRDAAVERANRVVAIRRAIQELSAIAVAEEARAAEAEARRAAKALRQQQRQGVVRHIDPTASDCDAINSLSCPPHLINGTTTAVVANANFDSNAALLDDNDNSNMIGFGVGDATHHNGEDDEDDDAYNTNTPCKYGILAQQQQQQQRAGAPSRSGGAHRSQQQQNGGEDSSNDSSSAVLLGGEETVMLMPQTDGTTAEEAAAGTPPIGYAPMAGRSGALPLPPSVVSSQQQQQPLPIASALAAMAASVDAHVDALLCFEEEGFDAATVAIQCYLSEAEADVASACVAALLPDGALHPSLLERGRLPVSPSLPQGILSRYGESLISGFATSLARCLVLRTQQRDKLNALHLSLQQPPHSDGLTGQF